jgi:hypothetical protein
LVDASRDHESMNHVVGGGDHADFLSTGTTSGYQPLTGSYQRVGQPSGRIYRTSRSGCRV